MSFYNYIQDISNTDKFNYIVIIIACIILLNRLNLANNTIIGIIVGIALVYYLQEKSNHLRTNFIADMEHKLQARIFRGAKNMHLDSELVDLLYSLREYRYYSPAIFRKLIKTIDQFLQRVHDMEIGVYHMAENYQILEEYKLRSLNALHSIIHNMPSSIATNAKLQQALDRLEDLLNKHMDDCYQYMIYHYGKKQINIDTKFIYKNHPKPFNQSPQKTSEFFG